MLNIDTNAQLHISAASLIGESVAVLGIKGSGKTNTAAVLIEELLPVLPLTIVDIEGEYWGLKEKFELLVAGKSPNVDVEMGVEQAAALAKFSVENSLSLVLDVSEMSDETRNEFLLRYFTSLWEVAFSARKPYQIVLEEAHEFVPQGVRTDLKQILTRIALRGRKRGLGIISVSQRSAKVEKDILTQAAVLFLHKVRHPTDIKVYQDIIPLPGREVEQRINALERGQAIVLYGSEITTAQIRVRDTFHVGATPDLESASAPKLRTIDAALLAELHKLAPVEAVGEGVPIAQYKALEAENERLRHELERAREAVKHIENTAVPATKTVTAAEPLARIFTPPAPLLAGNADRTEAGVNRALKRQQERFHTLLSDLLQMRAVQREIVAYLLDRPESRFNAVQLARALGYAHSTIYSPTTAVRYGLVKSLKSGRDTYYQATAEARLRVDFPDLDTDALLDQLKRKLKA